MTSQADIDEAIAENKLMAIKLLPVLGMAILLGLCAAGIAYSASGRGGAISAGISTAAGYIYGNLSPTGKLKISTEGLKEPPK